MPRYKAKITITNRQGLHARPASLFVQMANRFRCQIRLRKGGEEVDGKSIMGLLMLALERGSTVELIADGVDADAAGAALSRFLQRDEEPAGPPAYRGARG
ncbi:MAG: HPr family phosphocarrier protein [Candidatus Omnitrophica bacterium]|nr:HPr family phosphocarrier protein [Candidatus Omnitrophota bacterium]